jgi:hypothetical protein
VRVTRVGEGVLLEPVSTDWDATFAKIDALGGDPFPAREQPPMPPDKKLFD